MPLSPRGRKITAALLRRFPLPGLDGDGDKEHRGRVLVVGGETSLPGAVVLASVAALRVGAGKLQIAAGRSISVHIGVAVPESMSLGLRETREGRISPASAKEIAGLAADADAVLVGPGMTTATSNTRLTSAIIESGLTPIVLDAGALGALRQSAGILGPRQGAAVLTPHAGEMATLLSIGEDEVAENAPDIAVEAATRFGATVILKGATTFIANPDASLFLYDKGDIGLATSGSGDALAGMTAGLLARGAPPLNAALWAVHLHGAAGNLLARKFGRVGYLARELLQEVPGLIRSR